MIEVLSRDGVARRVLWSAGGIGIETPAMLFLVTPGVLPFERGEAFISSQGPVEGRFTIEAAESWFLGRPLSERLGTGSPPRDAEEGQGPRPGAAESGRPTREGAFSTGSLSSPGGAESGRPTPSVQGVRLPPFPNIPPGFEPSRGGAARAALESLRAVGSPILPLAGDAWGEPGGEGAIDIRETGAEAVVFASGLQLSTSPRDFARALVRLKEAAGYGRVIYAPGLGEPGHLALLVYAGIDLFDSSPLLAAARAGLRLFPGWRAGVSEKGICHCPACRRLEAKLAGHAGDVERGAGASSESSVAGSLVCARAPNPEEVRLIYEHNCYAASAELGTIRAAISSGRLRELVESRLSDPWAVALLRHLDLRHGAFLERYCPVARPAGGRGAALVALGTASLTRPEVARFRERVLERYRRPPSSPVLLILPCSARKPYSSSVSHRAFRAAVESSGNPGAVHRVVVTSPLGVVPLELECFYPANSYDIPVTGDWEEQETRLLKDQLVRFIERGRYHSVVCHLSGMEFLREALPASAQFTGGERPASAPSLTEMASTLRELAGAEAHVDGQDAERERAEALCRFQWGEGAGALAEGCLVRRRGAATVFLACGGKQLGLLSPERGLVSLTLAGGERLLGRTGYEVEIEDFMPTGAVFAPGVVRAGSEIRPGDEVLVTHKGELRGVGVAVMSGSEMMERGRGAAVRLRHHRPAGGRGEAGGSGSAG